MQTVKFKRSLKENNVNNSYQNYMSKISKFVQFQFPSDFEMEIEPMKFQDLIYTIDITQYYIIYQDQRCNLIFCKG